MTVSFNSTANIMFGWELDEQLNGQAMSSILSLELLLALPTNLLIVIHSISDWKENLKKSATILLLSLALSNLVMAMFYMPFAVVATGAEEWIFGSSDRVRDIVCQINGFIYEYSVTVTGHILVFISIDRFLYIVLASHHHKIMTWKVTLGIVATVWTLSLFWSLSPYYGSGLGYYGYSFKSGSCVPFILKDNFLASIIYIVYSIILFSIILISTLWSFIFTHAYLKKKLQLQWGIYDSQYQQHIYLKKVRNLIGLCGALLVANFLSWLPYFVSAFYALTGDRMDKIPVKLNAALFILSLSNEVANPVIQIYFRRELRHSITKMFKFLAKSKKLCTLRKDIPSSEEGQQRNMKGGHSDDTLEMGISMLSLVIQNGGKERTINKAQKLNLEQVLSVDV